MRKTVLAAAAALFACAAPAMAQATLDQSNWGDSFTSDPYAFGAVGQSFTAGLTGQLSEIDILNDYFTNGTVTFEVRSGDGTGGALLGSATQSVTCGPGATYYCGMDLDLSALGISVTAGSQYTFMITGTTGDLSAKGPIIYTSDTYSGGHLYSAAYGNPTNWDIDFRTFVDQGGSGDVPEPASWALMVGGFGLVGGALRSRRGLAAHG